MLGLRTAQMVFRSRASPVAVSLYPMVHVGDASFYEEVYDEAFAHDVVLLEGINSPVSRNLTRSYRWINFQKLGLVIQPKSPPQESAAARIVHADLTAEEFHRHWREVPLLLRWALGFAAPLYGIYRRIFSSRESLAQNMCLEDRKSAEELLSWSPKFEPMTAAILDVRNRRLIQCLRAELEEDKKKRVAIIYGAQHMRAVLRELVDRGFQSSDARWQTIISL